MLFLWFSSGCAQQPPTSPVSVVSGMPAQRISIDLPLLQPVFIPEFQATITLLSSETRTGFENNKKREGVQGRLLIEQNGIKEEVDFKEGSAIERWGCTLLILGDASWLRLNIYPPGVPVRP